ncbi:MAG: hypothetical protein JWQ95_4340 [Sphaerisporangium sp.]|nr:hypothetical protein [Sphaerisporangium sp.]
MSGTTGGSRLVVGLREAFRLGRAPAVPGDDSATAQARAWIAANRGHLPQAYADIIAFSVVYRRLLFAELSRITKGAFWRDHLDAYAEGRAGELSPQQTTALKRARAVLGDPSAFAEPRSEARKRRMETTHAELRTSFGDDEMRDIFGIFRSPEAESSSP